MGSCPTAAQPDASPRAARPIRVVLADDHGRYRVGLATAIAGHRDLELVEAVADGQSALGAVEHHDPDVVLLDIRMPHVDGLEAARRLMGGRTAVVLLSGTVSEALTREAAAAGARALLTKDLSRREICLRLVQLAG